MGAARRPSSSSEPLTSILKRFVSFGRQKGLALDLVPLLGPKPNLPFAVHDTNESPGHAAGAAAVGRPHVTLRAPGRHRRPKAQGERTPWRLNGLTQAQHNA